MTGHRPLIAAPGPGGPLGRYVTDPGGTAARLARLLLHALAAWGPAAGPALAAAAAAVITGRAWLRRRQHQEYAARARQVVILAPPQADPAGAEALWGHLTGLLRPAWARWWHGQPHLGWEYSWTGGPGGGMTISIWVPGIIPPGLVERAVEAAWPGAHAVTSPARPALPGGVLATGGTLRLARTEILPLRTDLPSDPLRALAGAAAALGDGEHAVLQVLARPVTGARLRHARRAARRLRGGQAPRLTSRLLDLATPGGTGNPRRTAPAADPERAADIRAATAKMAALQWDTQIRYVTATTTAAAPEGGWRERLREGPARAQAMARLRGLAHGLASATALYAGPNWLARRPLPRPAGRENPCSGVAACCRSPSWPPSPSCPATRPFPAWTGPGHGRCRPRPVSRCPARTPARSASPTPARPARSPWPSPTGGITCGSSARPGRGSPLCSPGRCSLMRPRAGARCSSTPKATRSPTSWPGSPRTPPGRWCCSTPTTRPRRA